MIPEPAGMTCGFPGCHVKLNMLTRVWKDGRRAVSWVHGIAPEDVPYHDPVPVPETEIRGNLMCDFCGDLNPEWLCGCPAYEERLEREGDDSEFMAIARSDEGWAACYVCKDLIDQGDIKSLTDRAVAASELRGFLSQQTRKDRRRLKKMVWNAMHEQHQHFMRLRTGQDWLLIDGVDKERQKQALKEMFNQ